MAGLNLTVMAGEVAVTSTPKTFLTLKAPTNQRLKLKGIEVFGKGVAGTDTPVKIEIARVTTDGNTGTATAVTPGSTDDSHTETPQGTYFKTYGTEPTTYGTILRTIELHPQTGIVHFFPLGDEFKIKGAGILGIRMTSNQNETISLTAYVEE